MSIPTNDHHNSNKFMNKAPSKKFFQSKIDFAAPIKSLQKQNPGGFEQKNTEIAQLSADESDDQMLQFQMQQ
jgi:hypothetical protein